MFSELTRRALNPRIHIYRIPAEAPWLISMISLPVVILYDVQKFILTLTRKKGWIAGAEPAL